MLKRISGFFIIIYIIFTLPTNLFGDIRTENIELFLIVDKSKSMVEEIADVTGYINQVFINEFLIPGDRFVLIQFYGKADLIFDELITETSFKKIKESISSIPADGRFTDIGNALDTLRNTVETRTPTKLRQYMILLTDGKQEAPQDSRYYSPDGSFNHEFLENTKIIQRKGWKILILGIGSDTAVKELSDELSTTYRELDFTDNSVPQISKEEILGRITAANFKLDNGILSMSLSSEGYESTRIIEIEQIIYQISTGNHELISKALKIEIQPNEIKEVNIELDKKKIAMIQNKSEKGSLIFNFEGDTPFLPAVWETDIVLSADDLILDNNADSDKINEEKVQKNGNINNPWLIIVIIILIVAGVIAAVIIRNSLLHKDDDEQENGKKRKISDDN